MECGICYDSNLPSDKMEILLCKHSICISCYQKLIIKVCPFCRKRFLPIYKDNKEINSIYVNQINNNSIYRDIEREEIYNIRRSERLLRRQQRREKRGKGKGKLI